MYVHPLLIGIDEVRRNWGWFLVLGISLIVLGTFAISWSLLATIASVLLFGWLLVVSGVMEVVSSFWARRWTGFFLHLLAGVLDVVVGLLVVTHPAAAAAALTLLLAAFFMVSGIYRIVMAVALRFPNWGWALLGGVVTVLLGAMLWAEWPETAFWFIGLCVGIEMLFRGWSWVMFALTVRSLPKLPTVEEPALIGQ
jgi:uncharacterized membrane protein HdeD (DUF308 family)